ncbi:SRPBCC family protein [Pararhizobium sp. PWRC1-1]|uniref:SRPBCC family protein n=1 Tax=Pararhizobium sp. PWRC1-1 TaxID=2804566 RepID=UPI003CE66FE3
MKELELTVSRKIAASRERVFNAWLSPQMLAKFMMTPLPGSKPAKVSNDPIKGGRFSIVMVTPEKEIPHGGTYLEIDPFAHLSFTWESPYSLDDSVVTIDLAELGPESTEIIVRHVKFKSEEARQGHEQGWTAILGNLAAQFG